MFAAHAKRLLSFEAQSLLYRVSELRPFALTLPMVPAASPSVAAQSAIEAHLSRSRRQLRERLNGFLRWLHSPDGAMASPEIAQERFSALRLQFLSAIDVFDLFSDALSDRSQHGYGEWVGGLDVAATDALTLPRFLSDPPPILCHLDRGPGAAIRRVRTRLPGGDSNPVAVIRVPRERMIGSGVASSLVHEVGHQGAELLDLLPPLEARLRQRAFHARADRTAWLLFHQWISEIVSDLWSVARVGITSTMGLMGVVSLPSTFVYRVQPDDPHPTPWIRVKISAAIGHALYPDLQWADLAAVWDAFYPLSNAGASRPALSLVQAVIPEFISLLLETRMPRLMGAPVGMLFPRADRTPAKLRLLRGLVQRDIRKLALLSPTVALGVLGQAKFDGAIDARMEASTLSRLLRYWALRATVDASMARADRPRLPAVAAA
ncbi:MAG TPA: hypothetical protein VIP11_14090 [Gemmatimonadaceae bacterium]